MDALRKSTTRFLAVSLTLVLILTICIFSFLALYLRGQSKNTIRQVSQMYMSNINDQITMHFETAIGLRLDQLDTLVKTAVPEDIHENPEMQELLIRSARARDFTHVGFYRMDGTFHMLYGSSLQVTDPQPFMNSLLNREKKVAVGTDQRGRI